MSDLGLSKQKEAGQAARTPQHHAQQRLVAVVVTHNRPHHLARTLEHLWQSPAAELQAVVVADNASGPETEAVLAAQSDPRLVVQRSETNLGGAGGFARGMALARERFDPDWVLVMDDDARPVSGALAAFHEVDRSTHMAWAAAVRHPDGRICDINRPWINPFSHWSTFWSTLLGGGREAFHLGPDAYEATEPTEVDGGSFVGFFISRAGLDIAGYPDGRLFLYGDDVLYTLGLSRAGGTIAFDPSIHFEHAYSTLSDNDRRFSPFWKGYYHYRNLLLVYRAAAGPVLFWPALLLILPKWLLKIRHYADDKAAYWRLLRLAIRDGLRKDLSRSHDAIVALGQAVSDPKDKGA